MRGFQVRFLPCLTIRLRLCEMGPLSEAEVKSNPVEGGGHSEKRRENRENEFCPEVWLRGVDLNHRPLGYEPICVL